VRMGRANDRRVDLAGKRKVIAESPAAPQQAIVLLAPDRLTDGAGNKRHAGHTEDSRPVLCATTCYMRYAAGEVGVRELRQNLSVYLKRVKEGATLEVKERDHRVAVLAPVGAHSSALDRLIAAGRATAARGDLLDLGPPVARRSSRRASRALSRLRDETRRA